MVYIILLYFYIFKLTLCKLSYDVKIIDLIFNYYNILAYKFMIIFKSFSYRWVFQLW